MKEQTKTKLSKLYDKYYKYTLIFPILILILSFGYLWNFYQINNDFIYKDISLKGGTSVTIYENINVEELKLNLSTTLEDLSTREISDLITGERKAIVIETTTSGDQTKQILEDYLGYVLDETNSSFEFSESSFTQNFYKQLVWANLIAFVLMSIVVFLLFRTFIPSLTVIFAVFMDIVMTIATVDLLGIKLSTAGITAFLMLIGYSVDTDILLTTRLLKHEGSSVNSKIFGAFKTGITMTLVSLLAVVVAMLIVKSFSAILTQMFLIISIGLLFDILNTWITNAGILKWYVERKK